MQENPSWIEKLHYKVDEIFSKGTGVMISWLLLVAILIITIVALVVILFDISPPGESLNFIEVFWMSLLRTLDAGTMAEDEGWLFRIVMLVVTLGGVLGISVLIGAITTGLESRLRSLQRGRSKVVEVGHTVILGWGEKVFTVINEICIANENQNDGCVVILGDEDRVTMENQIREIIPDTLGTRIVCRSGSPIDPASLEILSLHSAKSIIILAPRTEDPDSEVIKICHAITRHAKRGKERFHIVAELRQAKNLAIAKIAGGSEVEWVMSDDIISRMIVQTCHQSGLSIIYTDLMDYAGDEIYFFSDPSLFGMTFGELLNRFDKNAVMGICKEGRTPELHPPMDTLFQKGDQLFLLAEDDDQIFINQFTSDLIMEDCIEHAVGELHEPEKVLILGWNSKAARILQEMDHYVPANSEILVAADKTFVNNAPAWNTIKLKNAKIEYQLEKTTDRDVLEKLDPSRFKHIILLSYSDSLSYQAADSRTLVTLLHLRDIANKCNHCDFTIVTEMLDLRNRELAEITKVDDFIVSDHYISLFLSQVSETKLLNHIFQDLLNSAGSEVYLKGVQEYIQLGVAVNFYTIVESARRKNEIAMGYRIGADANDAEKTYGIVLNPDKQSNYRYQQEDQVIVLAETF